MTTRGEAALARRDATIRRGDRPADRRWGPDLAGAPASPLRSAARATAPLAATLGVERAAAAAGTTGQVTLRGYASAYEQPYEMWDFFGPYTEVISAGAGEKSLATTPDVVFLFQHRAMPMARTRGAGTLDLSEDDHGLLSVARPEMELATSRETVTAVEKKLLHEMSFAFVIVRGIWSPDFEQFRIDAYDIDRGDTSVVTYGANPNTDIGVQRAESTDGTSRLTPADRATARSILTAPLIRA